MGPSCSSMSGSRSRSESSSKSIRVRSHPHKEPHTCNPTPQTLNHAKPQPLTPPPKHKPQTLTLPPNTLSADSLAIPLTSVRVGRGTFASTANWYQVQCLRVPSVWRQKTREEGE